MINFTEPKQLKLLRFFFYACPHMDGGKGERYMKKRMGKATSSIPLGLGCSVLVSMTVTLLAAVVMTFLIAGEYMQEAAMPTGAAIAMLLASIAGSLTVIIKIGQKTLWMCLASGAIYYLCLLAMTAMFFGGQYAQMGVSGVAVLIGSAVVILLSLRGSRGRNRRRIKYHVS